MLSTHISYVPNGNSYRRIMCMKTLNCIIPLLCCLCILSCHSRQIEEKQEKNETFDTIFVSYKEGIYETSARTPCNLMKEWSVDEEVSEVVVIAKEHYDAIFSYLSENSNKGNDSTACEARIYVQAANNEICFDDVIDCACDINEKSVPVNDYILYLIRSLSGYYNYLDSIDLKLDRLIGEYGVPSNYINRVHKFTNWEDEYNYDGYRKVALIRE